MITLFHDDIDVLRGKKVSIALGVFDGVHAGHRKLLDQLNACASEDGSAKVVYTFVNHPEAVLFGNAPKYIDSFEEKAEKFESIGVDYLWAATFTKEMAEMQPESFIQRLIQPFKVACLIAGYDYTFGDRALGHARDLEEYGRKYGFSTRIVPAVMDNGLPVSSSRIRESIKAGDVEDAGRLLRSAYRIQGTIESGRRIGTQMGFPTANIRYAPGKVLPANGVYITVLRLNGQRMPSVTNVGRNPTIGSANAVTIETHILDFDGDIYGQDASVEFIRRLRPEMRFPDRESLTMQIQRDIAQANAYFGE